MATHNWNIDVAHSGINFSIRHMVVSKLRGRFTKFTGTVRLDEGGDLTRSSVEASIDASGIDTGSAQRDDHLRGTDFFDVDRSPQLRFRSTQVLCSAWMGAEAARHAALQTLAARVSLQASVLAYEKVFLLQAVAFVVVLPLAFFLRAPRHNGGQKVTVDVE